MFAMFAPANPAPGPETDGRLALLTGNHTTEMPFYSISAEFYRGLVDLGAAWQEIGALHANATVSAAGAAMAAAAPPLLADLRSSMAASHAAATGPGAASCWPYVAGRTSCSELSAQPSRRDSEPWRTYAEMAWSGALEPSTLTDVIEWYVPWAGWLPCSRSHSSSIMLTHPAPGQVAGVQPEHAAWDAFW